MTQNINATLASGLSLKDIRKQSDQLAEAGKQFDNLFPRAPDVVVGDITRYGVSQGTCEPWLNGSDGVRNTHSTEESGYAAATDPHTILTMKATKKKAIHITQFLSENAKQKRLGDASPHLPSSDGRCGGVGLGGAFFLEEDFFSRLLGRLRSSASTTISANHQENMMRLKQRDDFNI